MTRSPFGSENDAPVKMPMVYDEKLHRWLDVDVSDTSNVSKTNPQLCYVCVTNPCECVDCVSREICAQGKRAVELLEKETAPSLVVAQPMEEKAEKAKPAGVNKHKARCAESREKTRELFRAALESGEPVKWLMAHKSATKKPRRTSIKILAENSFRMYCKNYPDILEAYNKEHARPEAVAEVSTPIPVAADLPETKENPEKKADYKLVKRVGVLSETESGWMKELNCIVWFDQPEAKLDLRNWNADHTLLSKGITLTRAEALELRNLLNEYLKEAVREELLQKVKAVQEMQEQIDALNEQLKMFE